MSPPPSYSYINVAGGGGSVKRGGGALYNREALASLLKPKLFFFKKKRISPRKRPPGLEYNKTGEGEDRRGLFIN